MNERITLNKKISDGSLWTWIRKYSIYFGLSSEWSIGHIRQTLQQIVKNLSWKSFNENALSMKDKIEHYFKTNTAHISYGGILISEVISSKMFF